MFLPVKKILTYSPPWVPPLRDQTGPTRNIELFGRFEGWNAPFGDFPKVLGNSITPRARIGFIREEKKCVHRSLDIFLKTISPKFDREKGLQKL